MSRRTRGDIVRETNKHIRSRKKYKNKKGKFYNEHHAYPQCRGGPNRDYNIMFKPKAIHAAWHELFSFRTPEEAINLLKIYNLSEQRKKAYTTVFGYSASLEQALNIIQNEWNIDKNIYQIERSKRVNALTNFLTKVGTRGHFFDAKQRARFFDCKLTTRFQEGQYEYKNDYFGFNPCYGREIIKHNARQVYTLQYFSNVIVDNVAIEIIYAFLEKALKIVDINNPFWGPKEYSQNGFLYMNHKEGNIESFHGFAEIFYNNQKAYECHYHGGLLIPK